MEKVTQITKNTLVPLGFIIIVFSAAYFFGSLVSRVSAQEAKTDNLSDLVLTMPTRAEFNSMRDDVTDIKNFLLKKNE